MNQQPQLPADLFSGAVLSVIFFFFGFAASCDVGLIFPPVINFLNEWFEFVRPPSWEFLFRWPWMCLRVIFDDLILPHPMGRVATIFGGEGMIFGGWAAWCGWKIGVTPPDAVQHIEGCQLSINPQDLKKEMDDEIKLSGSGIPIFPGVPMSIDRETKSMVIVGSMGGGKTQILLGLINSILARGDKILLHDNKGDFTSLFLNDPCAILLAPWDERSAAWNISADTPANIDALELASKIIPESGDNPMWSNAARILFAGIIGYYQKHMPNWGWGEIIGAIEKPYAELRALAIEGNPRATLLLPEKLDKTTQGFIVQMVSSLIFVSYFANAWGDKPQEERFSIREWALSDNIKKRLIIAQSHANYSALSKAFLQSIIQSVKSQISDMEDSKTRRIWLVLDEFPQLGEIRDILNIVAVGRSKGIRVILGIQALSQMTEIYGQEAASSLVSTMGTMIICKSQGDNTEQLVKFIGKRTVRRYNPSHSGQPGGYSVFSGNVQRSDNWQIVPDAPVVPESQLASQLGTTERGIKALLLTYGKAELVYRLIWSYQKSDGVAAAHVLAQWTREPTNHAEERLVAAASAAMAAVDQNPAEPELSPPPAKETLPVKPATVETEIVKIDESLDFLKWPAEVPDDDLSNPFPFEDQVDPDKEQAGDDATEKLGEQVLDSLLENALPEPLSVAVQLMEAVSDGQEAASNDTASGVITATTALPRRKKLRRRILTNDHDHDDIGLSP